VISVPRRQRRQAGRHALVDGIPFVLPVDSTDVSALMAGFTIDADRAGRLLPGNELHPVRLLRNRGLLVVTVVDYRATDIGKYIEFSVAIACTHGRRAAPPLLPGLLQRPFGTGQYVVDLPVSTEISVKGGKGIWGMPKHQANLDFVADERQVSSQYDKDGRLAVRIEIDRPRRLRLPLDVPGTNYCQFRGMLMKSSVYFSGPMHVAVGRRASARLTLGDHPRVDPLRTLEIADRPLFTGYLPAARGVLDDHFESWFLSYEQAPTTEPEGLKSVVDLGLSQEWLDPPRVGR
jgi:Acetoacetate decarboxylase (ADC)